MNITCNGYTQPIRTYISGVLGNRVDPSQVEAWATDCENGRYTARQITRIVEGAERLDVTFS